MNKNVNHSNLLMDALSAFANDKATSASEALIFSGDIIQSLHGYIDPEDSLELGGCCNPASGATCKETPDGDIDPSYGNYREGKMPTTAPVNESDTSVQPLGAPSASAIVAKINTKTKAKTMNILLHSFWKMLKERDQHEMGFDKSKIIAAHTALVEKMKSKNWNHQYMDTLDDTLPAHLRGTIVGPGNPPKDKQDDEREQITVAPKDVEAANLKIDSTLHVALPEVSVTKESCFKLKKSEVDSFLGDTAKDITANLPPDALYLLVDAVETGTFNKVEISKAELDNAAPGYAGRMFVEGHDWNNPQKAIGQILKASVVFSPEKGKWVMKVLAVVLREDAIKNFERGLYKFVSIGATMKAICSICDLTVADGCRHMKGMVYERKGEKVECKYRAAELQMEELSAVNVPACRSASAYGKVSREQARELLAASLETGSGEQLVALEAAIELQEIIYGDRAQQFKGETNNMANWQTEFRISDAQGYNCLLQKAEQYPMLSRTYGNLLSHRGIPQDTDSLMFAHELLHRWFNQPSRAKGWTEDQIVEKHDEVVAALMELEIEIPDASVMDSVLHSKSASLKDGGAAAASPAAAPAANASGPDTALKFPPVDEEKDDKDEENKKDAEKQEEKENFAKNKSACNDGDDSFYDGDEDDEDDEDFDDCEKKCAKNAKTLKSNKILNDNNIADVENPDDEEEDMNSNKTQNQESEIKHEAVSLNDGTARRAGYQDGVAKAQAGETKAKGKSQNSGAELPVKGNDYRKGYEAGYKESNKHGENDYVDDQISKGGIEMTVENTDQVVLEKAQKDEAKRSGAVKDFGTRKEQGVAKPEVKYSDKDEKFERKEEKGDTNSQHDYDAEKGHAKPEVQYVDQKKDGTNYGYLKCPKCNTGNIMQDTKKCPNCGAPHSDLLPIKEEERMGDFPYMKTQTAFDAPPMEAKTPGVPTPAAQKSKLSADDGDNFVAIQGEIRLLKEHISKISAQAENEKDTWYAERREIVQANQGLSEALTAAKEANATLQLDLETKNSMYKTLLEEHNELLRQAEEHTKFQKRQLVDEIVDSKINLGLLDDTSSEDQANYYMEKPIETLRVLHEEVTSNTKRITDMVLQSKFGVPKEECGAKPPVTTEGVKVSKGEAVESKDEAKDKQEIIDKMLDEDEAAEKAEEVKELKQGAVQDSNSIMAQVRRSLNTNRRTK